MEIAMIFLTIAAMIQLPLLLPTRLVPLDEIVCVDSAIGVFSKPYVPKSQYWSHVIPETGRINLLYSPISFYALAFILKLLGLRPLAAGLLHALVRVVSASVIYATGHQLGIPSWMNGLLVASWVMLCVGPVGRPDDLALLFFTLSYRLIISHNPNCTDFAIAGVLVGLSFLTYPGMVILLPVLFALSAIHYSLSIGFEAVIVMSLVGGFVSLLWLIWIIPFWSEFRAVFLEFALPDAQSISRRKSLSEALRWLIYGVRSSPVPFHYSVLPLCALLMIGLAYEIQIDIINGTIVLLTMATLLGYLSGFRIHKDYNLVPLNVSVLWFTQILLARNIEQWNNATDAQIVLGIALGFQLFSSLVMAMLRLVGIWDAYSKCGLNRHEWLLAQIPAKERVLTNQGHVFYALRGRNPILFPAGLSGKTPGGIQFDTEYDNSFRWLVLSHRLPDNDSVQNANPGAKFGWDSRTISYFLDHYELIGTSDLDESCNIIRGLSRFSGLIPLVCLYRLK